MLLLSRKFSTTIDFQTKKENDAKESKGKTNLVKKRKDKPEGKSQEKRNKKQSPVKQNLSIFPLKKKKIVFALFDLYLI